MFFIWLESESSLFFIITLSFLVGTCYFFSHFKYIHNCLLKWIITVKLFCVKMLISLSYQSVRTLFISHTKIFLESHIMRAWEQIIKGTGNLILWNVELIKTLNLCLPSSDTIFLEPGVGEGIMLPPYLQEKVEPKLPMLPLTHPGLGEEE